MEDKLKLTKEELEQASADYDGMKQEYEAVEEQMETIDESIEHSKNQLNETSMLKAAAGEPDRTFKRTDPQCTYER